MTTDTRPVTVTPDQRRQKLSQAIHKELRKGGRVETQSDHDAIIRHGKDTNHTFHVIMSVVTAGLWAWVWLATGLGNMLGRKTVTLAVDEFGEVVRKKV